MTHLSSKDLLTLNTALLSLYDPNGPVPFGARLVVLLQKLIGADIFSYDEIDAQTQRAQSLWAPSTVTMIPDGLEILARHVDDNPIVPHFKRTGDGRAMMVSDFLSQRQFRERPLYQQFYKPFRIRHHVITALSINEGATLTLACHRGRREFSERDRLLLNLARPHVMQAYRQFQLQEAVQQKLQCQQEALDTRDIGLLSASPRGCIEWITASGAQLLSRYGLETRGNRLPPVLMEWARSRDIRQSQNDKPLDAPMPLVIPGSMGQLRVTRRVSGRSWTFCMEETDRPPSLSSLEALGLSHRETEILSWVTQGKSNWEIGTILGISPRTVQKHLERIYGRLGVENRHAAMALAMETVRNR